MNYQRKEWMSRGQCALQSAAASGIIHDIQRMSEWLNTKTPLSPLRLPENYEESEVSLTWHQEVSIRPAEYFRTVVFPSQRGMEGRSTVHSHDLRGG